MIFTFGLKRGDFPKCKIQFSLAPTNRITSAPESALELKLKKKQFDNFNSIQQEACQQKKLAN